MAFEIPRGVRPGQEAKLLGATREELGAQAQTTRAITNTALATVDKVTKTYGDIVTAERKKQAEAADAQSLSDFTIEVTKSGAELDAIEGVVGVDALKQQEDKLKSFMEGLPGTAKGKASLRQAFNEGMAARRADFAERDRGVAEDAAVASVDTSMTDLLLAGNTKDAELLVTALRTMPLFADKTSKYAKMIRGYEKAIENTANANQVDSLLLRTREVFFQRGEKAARESIDRILNNPTVADSVKNEVFRSGRQMISSLQSDLDSIDLEAERVAKDARDKQMSLLETRVRFGEPDEQGNRKFVTQPELDAMLLTGDITNDEFNKLSGYATSIAAKQLNSRQLFNRQIVALTAGQTLSVSAKEKSANGEYWGQVFPQPEGFSTWPADSKAQLMSWVSMGWDAPQINNLLEAGLSQGAPGVTESAVALARTLRAASGSQVWGNIAGEQQAFYDEISSKMDGGLSFQQAENETRRLFDLKNVPGERERLDRRLRAELEDDKDWSRALRSRLREVDLPDDFVDQRMVNDFMRTTFDINRLKGGGDIKATLNTAFTRTNSRFGLSGLTPSGDPAMTLFPAERSPEYTVNFSTEEVAADLEKEIEGIPGYDSDRYRYTPEVTTGAVFSFLSATGEQYKSRVYSIRVTPKDPTDEAPAALFFEDEVGVIVMYAPDYKAFASAQQTTLDALAKQQSEEMRQKADEFDPAVELQKDTMQRDLRASALRTPI